MAKERIITPFPNGESYVQVEERMRQFIQELQTKYAQKRIAIVAHQAPPTWTWSHLQQQNMGRSHRRGLAEQKPQRMETRMGI